MDKYKINKQTALVLGIPSVIVFIGGLLVLVLLHVLISTIIESFKKNYDYDKELTYADWPLWVIGFGYMFPGLLGLLSAFIQNKGLYIATIVITILLLIIMAGVTIFVCICMYLFGDIKNWLNSEDCYDNVIGICSCRGSSSNLSMSCSSYKRVNSLSVAVSFFLVFTWVAQLFMFVLCCYYTCCAKTEFSQGVVIATTNQQQPIVNQNTSSASTQAFPPTNLPPWQYSNQMAPNKV